MDHYGLLRTVTLLTQATHEASLARKDAVPRWKWKATPVIFPESKCPYCATTIRSNMIWFLGEERLSRLYGAIQPKRGGRVKLEQPFHPHHTGGGYLCLGGHPHGIALFSNPPNLRDLPMGREFTAKWVNKYWGHYCKEMTLHLLSYGFYAEEKELIKP